MGLRSSEATKTADVVAELLDGVMAVDEEMLLKEVTQLQKREKCEYNLK